MNSLVSGSYVAVVSISTALLPKPSSVSPKQPTSLRLSIPSRRTLWCQSVPSLRTVPPNRLKWTIILMVNDGRQFMSSKDSQRIVPEVKNRDEFIVTNPLQSKNLKLKMVIVATVCFCRFCLLASEPMSLDRYS